MRTALERAHEALTERFDTEDPSAWRRKGRTTEFVTIGAPEGPAIELVNRGSRNQAVPPATDEGWGVLPPGNSAHLSVGELLQGGTANPPTRLTDQLEAYENFAYRPFPVGRRAVEANAERQEVLSGWLREE